MSAQRKLSKVAEAYERAKPAHNVLHQCGARCIEATEEKVGILWQRWIIGPDGTSLILYATPHGWDVFAPLTKSNLTDDALREIRKLASPEAFE